jgi:hypothetical protein
MAPKGRTRERGGFLGPREGEPIDAPCRFSALWSTTRAVPSERKMDQYGAGLAEYRVLTVIASRY